MLSNDDQNPPPQIPLLNNSKSHSSGIDDSNKPLLVDLFPSGQLPKFSIRDYAFSSRSKGVENSWPFSGKNLEACIKDGLKNVLPPFESPEAIRKSSRGAVVSEKVFKSPESSRKSTLGAVVSEKVFEPPEAVRKPTLGTIGSEKEKDDHGMFVDSDDAGCNLVPPILVEGVNKESTCSKIDSFPTRKSRESEAEILPGKTLAKPKPTANRTTQAPVKKHKLTVKVANLSAKEDNPVNSFMVSEAMASKVCPVCKTFSSSSNTTLNAHIDQCLSGDGEPTVKWSSPSPSASKVAIKNKIRSKKMKSMVEIYRTAVHCTLEELDRRNGSNWAGNSNLPAQGTDRAVATEQKKQVNSSPPANLEEIPDEGDVYIDENGTKVRILSKSSDQPSPPPKKVVNREKESKFLISKKMKLVQLQKRQSKLMKHNRKKLSSRARRSFSKIDSDQDNFSGEDSSEKEARVTRSLRQDMIRWSGSKRTEITKRSSYREGARRSAVTGETSFSSPKKRTDKPSSELHENPELPLRKRLRHASMESQLPADREKSSQAVKQSRKEKRPNQEDSVSQIGKRKVQMFVGQVRKVDHPKPSSGPNTKDRMSSSPGSKLNFKRKLPACKKSRVEFSSESTEEENGRYHHGRMVRTSDIVSVDRTRVFRTRSGEEGLYLHDSEDQGGSFMLNSSSGGSSSSSSSSDDDDESAQKNVHTSEDEDFLSGFKNNREFHYADNSSDSDMDLSDDQKESETPHIEDQDPILNDSQPDQEMFCGTEFPENLNVTVTELDGIPIPGPPGSFLPSPERMISEDLAGRSSLTSSRIQSSDDRHELVDQSSDSPISALSAISNPTLGRSDPQLATDGNGNGNGNSLQVLDAMKDKLTISVAGEQQPCCCSRKEGFSSSSQKPSVSLNQQESQLLRRRTLPGEVMLPSRLDSFKSDLSSVTSTRSSGDDGKGPNSPSTPMLRLMGKDLVVVNNEEPRVSQPPPHSSRSSQNAQWPPQVLPPGHHPGWRNAAINPPEIIVIDDGPENEPSPQPPRGLMQQPVAMPSASGSGLGFRPHGSSGYGYATPHFNPPNAYRGFWMGPSNAGNVNLNPPPAQWNWPPEGSAMVHPNQMNRNPNPNQLNPNPPLKFYTYPNFK